MGVRLGIPQYKAYILSIKLIADPLFFRLMRHISGLDPAATQFANRVSHVTSLNIKCRVRSWHRVERQSRHHTCRG